jgi:hypothetical protein
VFTTLGEGDLVKIGTLVKPIEGGNQLYLKTDEYINRKKGNNHSNLIFTPDEIGLVLEIKKVSWCSGYLYRVLTPKGVGWVPELWVEVIS